MQRLEEADRMAVVEHLASTETLILPDRGWFDWRLRQLWRYRDLVGLFVWRDFVSLYKQTILGPIWHVVQPLFTTVIFTVVFSRFANLSTDGASPFLFYMSGSVVWAYFANCVNGTSRTFVANIGLLGKVYFHRMVIPVSVVLSNLISFGIQFAIFLIVVAAHAGSGAPVHVTPLAILSPVLLLMLAGYSLGIGIIVAALTTRYRDLTYLVGFSIQLLMYLTPVIYPISAVPARYRSFAKLNPLSPILEGFRLGFLGVGTVTLRDLAASFAVMLVVVTVGLILFNRVERTFMDTV
jgi:lipopolysaccharide transport system permease protein